MNKCDETVGFITFKMPLCSLIEAPKYFIKKVQFPHITIKYLYNIHFTAKIMDSISLEKCKTILKHYYGLEATINHINGGGSASVFMVNTQDNRYVLKVYDKANPITQKYISNLDFSLLALKSLLKIEFVSTRIASPIHSLSGTYKIENDVCAYTLSEYIEGKVSGRGSLQKNHIEQLSEFLGILHSQALEICLSWQAPSENFELPFLKNLSTKNFCSNKNIISILNRYSYETEFFIDRLLELSYKLKKKSQEYVLCHTDINNWNIILSGSNVCLIDWDGMKFAPAEHDLFPFILSPHWSIFYKNYQNHIIDYKLDVDAFEYYFIKKKLEDICEWIERLDSKCFSAGQQYIFFSRLKHEFKDYPILMNTREKISLILNSKFS